MQLQNWSASETIVPRGAWTAVALLSKNHPARASIAQNMRFFPEYTYSREGTSAVVIGAFTATAGKVGGMFNWISPSDNFLIYLDGTNIKRLRLADGTITTITSGGASPRYPSIADLGPRVYCAAADNTGTGQILPVVHDGASQTDACFRGPLSVTSFTAVDGGGGGLCTIGTHKLAFIFQSRNGFAGQPSPINVTTFSPASVTLAAGLHSITFDAQFTGPSDAGAGSLIIPIMTRADNLNNWFIVPTSALNTGQYSSAGVGAGQHIIYTINISDEDLANATSAMPYFDYMVSNGALGTTTPPNADFIVAYGKRMCYGQGNKLFVSEINNPQAITADLNLVSNPSQRRIKYAFPINQMLYLGGDKWTASVRDNGDSPATWPSPSTISDAKGPAFPNCVEFQTLGGFAWIATEFGLEVFNGAYADRPITYLWNDQWKRVNWNAAYAIQIADDTINLRCRVAVPLDANTECSHVFVVDYSRGLTWDTCDISIDNYGFGNFSSIQMVKENATTNKTALWIGPQAAGAVAREDSSSHADLATNIIHAIWESGYDRKTGEMNTPLIRLGAQAILAKGSGTLIPTWYNMDRSISVSPCLLDTGAVAGQIPLGTAPGKEYVVRGDLNNTENYSVRMEVNALGDWFQCFGYRTYRRPQRSNR